MPLPGVAVCPQTTLVRNVMSHPLRIHQRGHCWMLVDRPASLKVDADLKTLRMKAARPVERPRTFEVMPFDTYTITRKTSK
jgi:hypothetical protein